MELEGTRKCMCAYNQPVDTVGEFVAGGKDVSCFSSSFSEGVA